MFDMFATTQNSLQAFVNAIQILSADLQHFQDDAYKGTDYTFQSLFSKSMTAVSGGTSPHGGVAAPATANIPSGLTLIPTGINFTQGSIKAGRALNAAVIGQDFFVVQAAIGSQFYYKRKSDFTFDSSGRLQDSFGRSVMGYRVVNGVADTSRLVPITLDPTTQDLFDVGFETDGVLMTNFNARETARQRQEANTIIPPGTALFQLGLAKFANPSKIAPIEGSAYSPTTGSGNPIAYGRSGEAGFSTVQGTAAEASNVNPADITVLGIQLQRGYNAVLSSLTTINKVITDFISKVS